ncbi:MAG: hypothetical protein IKD72_10330, partial [Clostridia bacterium]|nr:hypothetical protein [Clostridia bacterium]
LANWYFVRFYTSRKQFSICAALVTFLFSAVAFAWGFVHYRLGGAALAALREAIAQTGFFRAVGDMVAPAGVLCGLAFMAVLVAASALLSARFAKLLGKD